MYSFPYSVTSVARQKCLPIFHLEGYAMCIFIYYNKTERNIDKKWKREKKSEVKPSCWQQNIDVILISLSSLYSIAFSYIFWHKLKRSS